MMTPKQKATERAILTLAHHNFQAGLRLHALFKLRDGAKSDDLVQETFLKTWKYLLKGGKVVIMKAFLYHILNNLIVDEYRRHKTSSLDTLLEKGFEPADESTDRLFNFLDGKAAVVLIQHLPESYRKVMRLRYVQDLTLEEISLITGQTKNTVAVKLHRGLTKLKELYGRHDAKRGTKKSVDTND